MKKALAVACLVAAILGTACGGGDSAAAPPTPHVAAGEACNDAQYDLSKEPNYPVNYIHRWTTEAGCDVRLDVLMTRQGEDACGGAEVADILMGTPLGRPPDSSPARIYVKDPTNVFNDEETSEAFDPDASVPTDAVDSGYRQDGAELWTVPEDDAFVYLVSEDHVERWPQDQSPPGCG
jgi:hypothetical protein